MLGFLSQCVQFGSIDVQQTGGLVDEGASAAGTVTVHADVRHPVFVEEDHLAVLTANVNEGAGLRERLLHQGGGGNHLLHERESPQVGVAHAHRTGDGHLDHLLSETLRHGFQHRLNGLAYIHVVPLVVGVKDFVVNIQHHQFHRCGADVYSYF